MPSALAATAEDNNMECGKPKNITLLIKAFAPTSTYDDDLVEDFYERLGSTIKEIPRKDLIIQGNWNAKVGPDAYEQWPGTVGRFEAG